MKKKKFNAGKWISGLCSAGVAVLGFGCSSNDELMYGTPTGTYEIKGFVTDMDGKQVVNAEIRVAYPELDSNPNCDGISKTDNKGRYEVSGNTFPVRELKVVCIPDSPTLEPDSTIVDLVYKGKDKHNGWYRGKAEKTVDFKLKERENAE